MHACKYVCLYICIYIYIYVYVRVYVMYALPESYQCKNHHTCYRYFITCQAFFGPRIMHDQHQHALYTQKQSHGYTKNRQVHAHKSHLFGSSSFPYPSLVSKQCMPNTHSSALDQATTPSLRASISISRCRPALFLWLASASMCMGSPC
jgi:hypothetical protein